MRESPNKTTFRVRFLSDAFMLAGLYDRGESYWPFKMFWHCSVEANAAQMPKVVRPAIIKTALTIENVHNFGWVDENDFLVTSWSFSTSLESSRSNSSWSRTRDIFGKGSFGIWDLRGTHFRVFFQYCVYQSANQPCLQQSLRQLLNSTYPCNQTSSWATTLPAVGAVGAKTIYIRVFLDEPETFKTKTSNIEGQSTQTTRMENRTKYKS